MSAFLAPFATQLYYTSLYPSHYTYLLPLIQRC